MGKVILILIVAIIAIGCSSGNQFDPTLHNEGFKGITHKDSVGLINGSIDPNDWNLIYSDNTLNYYQSIAEFEDSLVLPERYYIHGAFPNPSRGRIKIIFGLPTHADVNVMVIDENLMTVRDTTFDSYFGIYDYFWDFKDNGGKSVAPGMYRVIYQIGPLSGYGDIWHIN